jgi:hypothetical protein
MTPTRWLIVAFWTGIILVGLFYMFQSVMTPPPPTVPEKHWFPPPMPGSVPAAPSADADVRLIHYVAHITPGAMSFTSDVVVKNFGSKKATGIQVRVQPYVGNQNSNPSQRFCGSRSGRDGHAVDHASDAQRCGPRADLRWKGRFPDGQSVTIFS